MLAAVRQKIRDDMREVVGGTFLSADFPLVAHEIALLDDLDFLEFVIRRFQEIPKRFKIVDADYLRQKILARDGVVVVESSHGILTDHFHGFHPHTSAIRTLPCFTHDMLRNGNYDGEIVNLAVTRAYGIRHGAGPMPTADPAMSESLLPGSHKEENRYQGKVRVGPLDLVLLRYAIACAGGSETFDGLAVTWFDQIQRNGFWRICNHYLGTNNQAFFSPSGELNVRFGTDESQLSYQQALGQQLQNCIPKIKEFPVSPNASQEELFDWCADILGKELGVDVRMVSFGPSEQDKVCKMTISRRRNDRCK
jgi:adenylosuccinate synthase